jgi:hypothetical protein
LPVQDGNSTFPDAQRIPTGLTKPARQIGFEAFRGNLLMAMKTGAKFAAVKTIECDLEFLELNITLECEESIQSVH